MVQNNRVYRCCRDCLLLAVSGKPLLHCPRPACCATGVKLGKVHASGGALEPHMVLIEAGLFAVKFKKKKSRKRAPGGGGAGSGQQ